MADFLDLRHDAVGLQTVLLHRLGPVPNGQENPTTVVIEKITTRTASTTKANRLVKV